MGSELRSPTQRFGAPPRHTAGPLPQRPRRVAGRSMASFASARATSYPAGYRNNGPSAGRTAPAYCGMTFAFKSCLRNFVRHRSRSCRGRLSHPPTNPTAQMFFRTPRSIPHPPPNPWPEAFGRDIFCSQKNDPVPGSRISFILAGIGSRYPASWEARCPGDGLTVPG